MALERFVECGDLYVDEFNKLKIKANIPVVI